MYNYLLVLLVRVNIKLRLGISMPIMVANLGFRFGS